MDAWVVSRFLAAVNTAAVNMDAPYGTQLLNAYLKKKC